MGIAFVKPPVMPPALLVCVETPYLFVGFSVNRSLAILPRILASAKPAPNSTPFTAGIENNKCAKQLSTLSKNGSPKPAGAPVTAHSTTPPMLSPSLFTSLNNSSIALRFDLSISGKSSSKSFFCGDTGLKESSSTSPIDLICENTSMPCFLSSVLAIAPKNTSGAVSLAEKCPPPDRSQKPLCFMYAAKSAWEGLAICGL